MTPEQHARAKALFAQAIQEPVGTREAFVQSAATDAIVRDEVLTLLRHHIDKTLVATDEPGLTDTQHLSQGVTVPHRRTWVREVELGVSGLFSGLAPRQQVAMGVMITCLLLGLTGLAANWALRSASHDIRESALRSSLNSTVRSLRLWIEQEKGRVEIIGNNPELERDAAALIAMAMEGASPAMLQEAEPQQQIRALLVETLGPEVRYAIWDRQFTTVADWSGVGLGRGVTPYGGSLLARVFAGETVIQLPGIRQPITEGYPQDTGKSFVGVVTPLRSADGTSIVAALLVYGLDAEDRFNEILGTVQIGKTGETYAFDKQGWMISESRFPDQLKQFGYLPTDAEHSALKVQVRDPGGDLTRGHQSSGNPNTWPLTKMARFATAGEDGIDLEGYRDYRGVQVVGAWDWLPEYEFGVVTEIELREINLSLRYVKLQQWVVFAMLAAAIASSVLAQVRLSRLRRQVGTNRQLGQYTLGEKIGEGGMGLVYRAHHALLKRPTAIKLLKAELANRRNIHWFQREVELASQLTHPNTIQIYDYGVTLDQLFYYVMEYLDGETVEDRVARQGPLAWPEAVRILTQVLGSLQEAHHAGLVHRDIKPRNIMLCTLGGVPDIVKVLDFGIARPMSGDQETASAVIAGTPRYMAPERFIDPQRNDPRSDLYSVGALAYFLLTGKEIFSELKEESLLAEILNPDTHPIAIEGISPIPAKLKAWVQSCLAKSMSDRPNDSEACLQTLRALS